MANDSVVDERTLREIYLTNFEIAVREGRPGAIMSSYNQINEVYTNEDPRLLRDILRDEWASTVWWSPTGAAPTTMWRACAPDPPTRDLVFHPGDARHRR